MLINTFVGKYTVVNSIFKFFKIENENIKRLYSLLKKIL